MSAGTIPTLPAYLPPPPPGPPGESGRPVLRAWTLEEFDRMIAAGVVSVAEVEFRDGWVVSKRLRGLAPEPRRWSVAEYHHLIRAGVLGESERVELLEGWIVLKMSRNTPHDVALSKTQSRVAASLPAGWFVRGQMAVTTGDSEPEPDCAIVAGEPDAYLAAHPGPADTALLVEIADSSVVFDRTRKGAVCGRAGFLVYWIVNVPDRQVEVYTDPTGPTDPPEVAGYRNRQDYHEVDTVPVVIRAQEVTRVHVAGLLPRV